MSQDMDTFWDTTERCRKTVETWPQWMQDIEISSEAASTGRFIRGHNSRNNRTDLSMADRK